MWDSIKFYRKRWRAKSILKGSALMGLEKEVQEGMLKGKVEVTEGQVLVLAQMML